MASTTGNPIRITVHLHTLLQRPTPQGLQRVINLEIQDENSLDRLIQDLEISLPLDSLLLVVNGRYAEVSQILQDGDEVHLIPAISGGNLCK